MTQPEALRLADELEFWEFSSTGLCGKAAAELRRLHEVETLYHAAMRGRHAMSDEVLDLTAQRDALLEALRWIDKRCPEPNWADVEPHRIHFEMAHDAGACARAAIAAVEDKTHG